MRGKLGGEAAGQDLCPGGDAEIKGSRKGLPGERRKNRSKTIRPSSQKQQRKMKCRSPSDLRFSGNWETTPFRKREVSIQKSKKLQNNETSGFKTKDWSGRRRKRRVNRRGKSLQRGEGWPAGFGRYTGNIRDDVTAGGGIPNCKKTALMEIDRMETRTHRQLPKG